MAIDPSTLYSSQIITSDAGWPYGRPQNDLVPGDGSGTPLEEAWVSDLFGWQQALLGEASITPSGNPDEVGASQYMTALHSLLASKYVETRMPDVARGAAVARTGLILPSEGAPSLHAASHWGCSSTGWTALQASAEAAVYFRKALPNGTTLLSVTMRFTMPAHSAWPPQHAPNIYIRRHNMSTLAVDLIAYSAIPITDQTAYQGYTSWLIDCEANNVFSEDYHSLEVAFYPEYGTNAELGTLVRGGITYATADRARVL